MLIRDRLELITMGVVGLTTRALTEAAPGTELTFSQWRAIMIVGESPRGARVGEVAARVGTTLPATSRQLHRLEQRGLLALSPDEADRRATRATLTDRGASVRAAILAYRRDVLAGIADRIDAAGLPADVLDIVVDGLEAYR